jgi:hypothetical protein
MILIADISERIGEYQFNNDLERMVKKISFITREGYHLRELLKNGCFSFDYFNCSALM